MAEPRTVLLAHGGGGRLMHELLAELLPLLSPTAAPPSVLNDAAVLEVEGCRLAFTTDSFVVTPAFFPGGDIGRLAVCGTVNDLAMVGARPVALSLGLVIEEGLPRETLERVLRSVAAAGAEAGVGVATGDTKVVERGAADGLFINTAGLGVVPAGVTLSGDAVQPGDAVLINGTIGDHGLAVLAARQQLGLRGGLTSDCAPLNSLVEALLAAAGPHLHCLRDPTRGGVAATLHEVAGQSGVAVQLEEAALPVAAPVQGACATLGLDPLYVANEGKALVFVAAEGAAAALEAMRAHPLGREAVEIGRVLPRTDDLTAVTMRTALGVVRVVDMPRGELLPRIC